MDMDKAITADIKDPAIRSLVEKLQDAAQKANVTLFIGLGFPCGRTMSFTFAPDALLLFMSQCFIQALQASAWRAMESEENEPEDDLVN